MAVNLSNKYQSTERRYIRQIGGIDETSPKLNAENLARQYGGVGEVWFQGYSPAGQSTGNGGGSGSGENPSGGGGGSGGGGQCICENISEADSVVGIPCCISGVECETGTPIKIQLDPSETPITPCETPKPPPKDDPDTIIIKWTRYNGFSTPSTTEYELSTMESGAGDANAAIQNSIDSFRSNVSACGSISNEHCQITETFSQNGKSFKYCSTMRFNTEKCGVFSAQIDILRATAGDTYYNAGLANWNKKNQQKQYFVKDGKFYNTCDPYGEPPSDEPITICDTDGNKYKVSPDGTITKIEQ